jgi:hypothetical protein
MTNQDAEYTAYRACLAQRDARAEGFEAGVAKGRDQATVRLTFGGSFSSWVFVAAVLVVGVPLVREVMFGVIDAFR